MEPGAILGQRSPQLDAHPRVPEAPDMLESGRLGIGGGQESDRNLIGHAHDVSAGPGGLGATATGAALPVTW